MICTLGRVTEDRDNVHWDCRCPCSIHEFVLVGFYRLLILLVFETLDDFFIRGSFEYCNTIAVRNWISTIFEQLHRLLIDVALRF